MVVKAGTGDIDLCCGGEPMLPFAAPGHDQLPLDPGLSTGSLIGKRYWNEESGIEVLVTKGGQGTLSAGGKQLVVKGVKALPSSD